MDLLRADRPLNLPPMPENRPQDIKCYVDCDEEYDHEVNRLHQAVVVHTTELSINFELSVDKVAEWVAESGVIKEHEITIARISRGRFIIILPQEMAPETLIEAMPRRIWDEGLSFQRWDPLEDTERVIPEFKTIVDFIDIPPPLYCEKQVINAVSKFGLYLGTVAQQNQDDISR